jgi:hypothetical protein
MSTRLALNVVATINNGCVELENVGVRRTLDARDQSTQSTAAFARQSINQPKKRSTRIIVARRNTLPKHGRPKTETNKTRALTLPWAAEAAAPIRSIENQ